MSTTASSMVRLNRALENRGILADLHEGDGRVQIELGAAGTARLIAILNEEDAIPALPQNGHLNGHHTPRKKPPAPSVLPDDWDQMSAGKPRPAAAQEPKLDRATAAEVIAHVRSIGRAARRLEQLVIEHARGG